MIAFGLSVIGILSILTGCGQDKDTSLSTQPSAICYAIAPTANSQGLNMNSPLVQDLVYDTIMENGYIGVVTVDGKPELVSSASYEIPEQYKNASKEKLKTDARANATNLITYMENQIANDAQVDYLEGLRMAARSLNSLSGYDSKTIIVIGTGLSTQGTLNFSNNLLSVDPQKVLELLEEKKEIPNLEGITVVWQQMGDVALPQEPLTQVQKKRLQEIWGGIVERGGGEFVYNEIMPNPVNENNKYPEVDAVALPTDTPIVFDEAELNEKEADIFTEPVMLTEEQVTFVPDKSDYLDEDMALKTIRPIADYLNRNMQVNILLTGCTAGDEDSEYTMNLSKNRAEKVKESLVALGVAEERIITVGAGSSDPWHVPGVGYEGSLASSNRKVVLMDASTDLAKKIISE